MTDRTQYLYADLKDLLDEAPELFKIHYNASGLAVTVPGKAQAIQYTPDADPWAFKAAVYEEVIRSMLRDGPAYD